jgi:inosine-uridine nucleoside N-ribohydrolase
MALHELKLYDRLDVPVAIGLGKPMFMPIRDHPVSQAAGVNASLLSKVDRRGAVQLIIDTVMAAPGEVMLVPIGALTNVAAALVAEPRLAKALRQIVIMGGVVGQPMAEYNIWCDPDAARIVFESGAVIRMVGLDVTMKCQLGPKHLERFAISSKPTVKWLWSRIQIWQRGQADRCPILHDPLAVATIFEPSICQAMPRRVCVETRGEFTRAFTIAYSDDQPNAEVCLDVDSIRFVELFTERIVGGA